MTFLPFTHIVAALVACRRKPRLRARDLQPPFSSRMDLIFG